MKVFKKILIKIWKNLTKNWKIFFILILSALKDLCWGATFTRFPLEPLLYCICFSKNLGGARRMIELFFKIRGGNVPPALPVADPMVQWTLTLAQDQTVTNSGMGANNAVSGTLLTALMSNASNASAPVSNASSARFE